MLLVLYFLRFALTLYKIGCTSAIEASFIALGLHQICKIKCMTKTSNNMDKTEQQKKDEQFMRRALVEAEAARDEGEIPVGAVIVAGDRIIARAHNLTETLGDVTAHAEMQAITSAANQLGGKYLADCTLYVTVEPCIMCAGALGWAQVRRVVYGASDEKRGFRVFAPKALHPKCEVVSGVLEEECRTLMTEFFKAKR